MIKKFAVLVPGYPSDENPNEFGFVHSRVRAYKKAELNIDVYKIASEKSEYIFEGVTVFCDKKENLKKRLADIEYDAMLIHFLDQDKIDIVGNKKCYVWAHGFEALSWKRRLFNLNPKFPLYVYNNINQLKAFKSFAVSNPNATFIFVSEWMYKITCKDIKHKIKNYEIIHNFIDETIFPYSEKLPEQRKKLLLIRSFETKKYANDISVKIIKKLSKKDYFSELSFTVYGKGRLFEKYISKINGFKNVKINNHFLSQSQIAEIQKENGIFICPTRQDAQGVSMCEAMCSGLVPLTSCNTAIPEFVTADSEGLLCDNNDVDSFVKAYEGLLCNPYKFLSMSKLASKRVREQCSFENTIQKEIDLINREVCHERN